MNQVMCYEASKGEIVFEKGDIATLFFIIKSGKISITFQSKEQ
jgi:hypothetical protein